MHGDSCPWKKRCWQLRETKHTNLVTASVRRRCAYFSYASIVWSADLCHWIRYQARRQLLVFPFNGGKWHMIALWPYNPLLALVCVHALMLVMMSLLGSVVDDEAFVRIVLFQILMEIFHFLVYVSHLKSNKLHKIPRLYNYLSPNTEIDSLIFILIEFDIYYL